MGRPTKPRVKGNLQPASSSRAAELAGGGNSLGFDNLGGFAQFVGGASVASGIVNSRPTTPSNDGFESPTSSVDLDPELVVILKKISKRDTVTKLKALEELEAYLQSNKNVISKILHNWVNLYSKLVLEVDRRVRLVANQVHVLITANAKKRLAPLLKEFIGPWFLAMYDQSKDVARVAQSSFEAVFSAEKRLNVISFCQKEILDYVTDMLLFKTAETLSDVRYVSTEDMHAKYGRIISSSFQVVSYLITELSMEERVKCQMEYDTILDDTTMWKKFATHNNPLIRQSLYNFIKTLLLKWTELMESRLELICPYFYASVFTEKIPSAHSDMWDALLLMTKKFPSSWILIGKKKPALPKLYHFLRSGLNGSVSISYPSMLALLANLPEELKSTPNFYVDVFDNFWKGLSTEFIDRSNSHIFLNAYAECVVYFAIILSKSKDEQSIKTATNLIENTFWDMIKIYFLGSRDKNVNDKLDQNGYAIIAKHLVVLASVESVKDYMATFWSHMDELLVQTIVDCNSIVTRAPLDMDVFCQKTGSFLTAISHEIELSKNKEKFTTLQNYTNDLSKRLVMTSLESSIVHKDKSFGLLVLSYQLIRSYQDSIIKTNGLTYATRQLVTLLSEGPENVGTPLISFYITVVENTKNVSEAQDLWTNLTSQLRTMITTDGMELRGSQALLLVLERIHSEKVAFNFTAQTEDLDYILKLFALTKLNEPAITIPRPILESSISAGLKIYLSNSSIPDECALPILANAENNLMAFNQLQYVQKGSHSLPEPTVQTLKTTLSTLVILQNVLESMEESKKLIELTNSIESEVFDAMFVTTKTPHEEEEQAKSEDNEELSLKISNCASAVWSQLIKNGSINEKSPLLERVKKSITDISYSASPTDSSRRTKKLLSTIFSDDHAHDEATTAILGTENDWRKLATATLGQQTNEYLSLAIVDSYAALSTQPLIDDAGELIPVSYDIYGLSSFGRFTLFLGEYLSDSKVSNQFFKNGERDWVMRQLLLTKLACEQGVMVPGLCRVWENKAVEGIRAFIHSIDTVFADWFANTIVPQSTIENASQWNAQLIDAVANKGETNDRLLRFVFHLMKPIEEDGVALSANVLQAVLQRLSIVAEWSVKDLEKWLPLIKAESSELDLLIKVAVLKSFKNSLSDTDAYKHYQSDLSSKLSGVSTMEKLDYDPEDPDVNRKKNYSLLALLNTSSLKYGAFDIPKQRLMYLIQGIRSLMQNDQDDYDFSSEQQKCRVQSQIAQLLKHLAVSIQDVSGSHWEFFLQCCFEWVVGADTSQPEELVVVYNALELFDTLYILSEDNDDLKDSVRDHLPIMSQALLNLMTKEEEYLQSQKKEDIEFSGYSKSRLVYQTVLADLLGHIPEKTLIDSDSFNNLISLVHTPNEVLQKCAYTLLKKYVAHRVQDLSVRLEFTETSEEETHVDIDKSVFDVLLNPPDLSNWQNSGLEEQALHEILGYLLSWMLMFDHFTDITFKLKQEYTAQLKEQEAVANLMLVLCKVLSIGQGHQGSKPFDLSPWSIIEYDTEGFDASSEMSYLILASHLYYRALTHIPSLVRLWWIDCKQRQVTIAVETYTERFFSQQLINNEMELVNRPDIKTQLEENEENEFTVKTLKAASEVTATYRVDEQNMQIAIKLPSNFPLRQIDVEGVQKVGVNDKQWRGWMFAVAAVIGSQNGNIVDALTVFKRNVNLHFSGVEDCTICYSIISIQDRSIPSKQCRTCKNKFHSSCLYKWFRSSNSASCPLCRTVF